jgi:pre-mRNA-splicing factor 18
MSFLDSIIQEEVSKKRKVLDAVNKESGSDKKLKYVSRAELERIREEDYRRKEKEREEKERQVTILYFTAAIIVYSYII